MKRKKASQGGETIVVLLAQDANAMQRRCKGRARIQGIQFQISGRVASQSCAACLVSWLGAWIE